MARLRAGVLGEPRNEMRDYHRYELKFRLPVALQTDLRRIAAPYMNLDPHALDRPQRRYTVRSIYFDSEDLLFYYDKLDSVKIRKKLRIRCYDRPEDAAPVFLEIKRKRGRRGYKERIAVPPNDLGRALKNDRDLLAGLSFPERKLIERFNSIVTVKHLRPVVLVTYEREPMVGTDDNRIRMTFDQNIRSLIDPSIDQLFAEEPLRQFEEREFVLELKFDERMPRWMAQLMRDLDLRSHSYSKYCHGIDAWRHTPQ